MAGGYVDAIKVIIDAEIQAKGGGLLRGFRHCEPFEAGNGDLSAMDREMHGSNGGKQGQHCEHEHNEHEFEGAEHS